MTIKYIYILVLPTYVYIGKYMYIGKTNLICILHTQAPNTTYVDDEWRFGI